MAHPVGKSIAERAPFYFETADDAIEELVHRNRMEKTARDYDNTLRRITNRFGVANFSFVTANDFIVFMGDISRFNEGSRSYVEKIVSAISYYQRTYIEDPKDRWIHDLRIKEMVDCLKCSKPAAVPRTPITEKNAGGDRAPARPLLGAVAGRVRHMPPTKRGD